MEYLPSSDPTKQHLPGLAGLLDRQFRLLREDTVGQFRDAVQIEYKRLTSHAHPNRYRSDRTMVFGISSIRMLLCFDLNSIGGKGSRLWLSLTNLPHWRKREPRSEKSGGEIPNNCRSMLLYALSLPQVVLSSSQFAILLRPPRQRTRTEKEMKFDWPDIGEPLMSDRICSSMRTEPH